MSTTKSASISRIVAVTGTLAVVGAVAGVLVVVATSAVISLLLIALGGSPHIPLDPFILAINGGVGATLAAVVAPIVAWTLLRRVPLGKAILWPTVGAAIGCVISLLVNGILNFPLGPSGFGSVGTVFGGGLCGLLVAAARLRRAYRAVSDQ